MKLKTESREKKGSNLDTTLLVSITDYLLTLIDKSILVSHSKNFTVVMHRQPKILTGWAKVLIYDSTEWLVPRMAVW